MKSKYLFNSSFDEIKTLEYVRNLIKSPFLNHNPEGLLEFTSDALGQKVIVGILAERYPEIIQNDQFNEWLASDSIEDKIPSKIIGKMLRHDVIPFIEDRLSSFSKRRITDTEKRIKNIQSVFRLTNEETEVLTLRYLIETCDVIDKYLYDKDFINFVRASTLKNLGHYILNASKSSLIHAMSNGTLFRSNLFENGDLDVERIELSAWCLGYLSGIGDSDLSHAFFSLANNETLDISDFNRSDDEIMVIDSLMRCPDSQNILLYGVPGTGKTSLAKCLAKRYKKELYSVKVSETDEHKDRLTAIFGTINMADKKKSIILIDEADEILNSSGAFFYKSTTNKSWINNLLDKHDKKVIWITNRVSEIDQSTMRRFSFSLEFKKFNSKQRLNVLRKELQRKKLVGYFPEHDLTNLCKDYSVNAGGIINAMNVLGVDKKTDKQTDFKKIRAVLKSHEKATVGRNTIMQNKREFDTYTLNGLNTSHDLANITSALQEYIQISEQESTQYNKSLSLLLYGLPGTGKTEFVYYLGNLLEKDIALKRSSDIQSMWVGQTEKNISGAFEDAQTDSNILFFDEADSFLFPRSSANHSWEKSFTNEILAQMDNYSGIVIFATNDIQGLDHAALRRFKFKIDFKTLTPGGNLHFYNSFLTPLVSNEIMLSIDEMEQIKQMKNLTPGDFAVVKDQFSFVKSKSITHKVLIESLYNELQHKITDKKPIGFSSI